MTYPSQSKTKNQLKTGEYQLKPDFRSNLVYQLLQGRKNLLIAKRRPQNITVQKPKYYIRKGNIANRNRSKPYISSLYPENQSETGFFELKTGNYELDYLKAKYTLYINLEDQIAILERNPSEKMGSK